MGPLFKDKVFWITGGGSGIGAALARHAAQHGAHVAVSGRRPERLKEVVDAIEQEGGRALALVCDVREHAELDRCVEAIIEHFGTLDVAVANAGFAISGKVTEQSREDWQRQFDTNVFGAAMTIKAAMPALRKSQGRAVLVGSVASIFTYPAGGLYCASKAALRAMGQALSIELHGTGVSCTTLHPGFVASEIGQVDNLGRFDAGRKDPRPMTLMWTSDKAAKVMLRAIFKRRRELVFTLHGVLATWIARHLPSLAFRIAISSTATSKANRLKEGRSTRS